MRLWSIHPKYLDSSGLVALWREALLAQAVLRGETRGYKNHPQLQRFLDSPIPRAAIANYLTFIFEEACRRNYCFDKSKIRYPTLREQRRFKSIAVTRRQVIFELSHLRKKLWQRNRGIYRKLARLAVPDVHPTFSVVDGEIAEWERAGRNRHGTKFRTADRSIRVTKKV